MEYQFFRDPITGFRAKISDEQALFGRWLTEELGNDAFRIEQLLSTIRNIKSQSQDTLLIEGKEVSLKLSSSEAQVDLNGVSDEFYDLSQYQDDDLKLDTDQISAGCGLDDFSSLLSAWRDFLNS